MSPLVVICLILGVVYAVKRPGVARMTSSEYPNTSPTDFDAWKRAELSSIDIFLAATWGQSILFLGIGLVIVSVFGQSTDRDTIEGLIHGLSWVQIAVFIIGIIASAIIGSKAQKLKSALAAR